MDAAGFQFAVLTPAGRGAVATIRLEGPGSSAVVAQRFQPATSKQRDFGFGRWKLHAAEHQEEIILRTTSEASYELHCHGGQAAISAIRETLLAAAGQELTWQDWLQRQTSKPNAQTTSLSQLAWSLLPRATTEHTANLLLQQTQDVWQTWLAELQALAAEGNWSLVEERLTSCLRLSAAGLHTTKPFRIVFAGRPNVGKSSLMNRLLGYERSIVFDQPGTTRDVVTAQAALGGWPVEFADTAGLRESLDLLESAGVERSRHQLTTADLVVLVFEAGQVLSEEEEQLLAAYAQALPVYNKADLSSASYDAETLLLSAQTGEGMEAFQESIVNRLVPVRPQPREPLPFCAEVCHWLKDLQAFPQAENKGTFQETLARFTA